MIRSKLLISLLFLWVCACTTSAPKESEKKLTEREIFYEKGQALFNNSLYAESAGFFLKVTQVKTAENDPIYNSSLWKLSLVYEKYGSYDKAILALQELKRQKASSISNFKVQLSLVKNFIRVSNKKMADRILKEVDAEVPMTRYGPNEVFNSLIDCISFNYDLSMVEELQFLGEIQKYFIYLMESADSSLNEKSTEILISLYEGFFAALQKDSFSPDFKRSLSVELLEQLRKFERYKINDLNLNPNTIAKFSTYSKTKQKILTDWLHQ